MCVKPEVLVSALKWAKNKAEWSFLNEILRSVAEKALYCYE